MSIAIGPNIRLIHKLTLTSWEITAYLGEFLPVLPDKLPDELRGMLREGLGKILTIGVKEPLPQIQFKDLLIVLNRFEPDSLKIKHATQKRVPVEVKRDMDVISNRWDTLRRRAKVAHALITYMREHNLKAAALVQRLEIGSSGYLTYLLTLRRSVTSPDLAGRIEALTGLPIAEFLTASRGGYRRNRPAKEEVERLLGRRKVRQIVQELNSLSDGDLDTIRALVQSLAGKKSTAQY